MADDDRSQSSSISAVRQFIETKLSAIPFFLPGPPIEEPPPLAERLACFINTKDVLFIVGEAGTRKEKLLNDIIVPCLEKFQGIKDIVTNYCTGENDMHFRFNHVTIFYSFEQLRANDQALILSRSRNTDNDKDQNAQDNKFKYIFISNAFKEELSGKFQKGVGVNFYSFVRSGIKIELPNIQDLFYLLPQIIELLIKEYMVDQEHNMEDVNLNLIEYMEMLLEGVDDNFAGLERMISNISVSRPNFLRLEFSDLVNMSEQRIDLWLPLIKNVDYIKFSQLLEFNSHYTGVMNWGDVQSPYQAKSAFHKENELEKRLYYYIKATLEYFGGKPLEQKTWEKLSEKKPPKVDKQESDLSEPEIDHQNSDQPIEGKESFKPKRDKQKESIKLLLNLKERGYKPTYSEQELMKDRSFSSYRSVFMQTEHIYEPLRNIFDNLEEINYDKYITYDDFNQIVKAPSPYFEKLLPESLRRFCNYKKGRFRDRTPGKVKLSVERKIEGEKKRIILFIK